MKKLLLTIVSVAAFAGIGVGQQPEPQATPQENRPNLMQQLGLSPDQLRQIREINQQRKPQVEDAQRRVREATRALDVAIYADNVDENEVKARLNDLQQAQADVARIRFTNELAIRKVLTPEQLGRFREMRRNFAVAARENQQQRRQERVETGQDQNSNRPLRQMIRQQNKQNRKLNNSTPPTQQPRPKQ